MSIVGGEKQYSPPGKSQLSTFSPGWNAALHSGIGKSWPWSEYGEPTFDDAALAMPNPD